MNSEGFEPPTSWAVTRCTIQLCYESAFAEASADIVRSVLHSIVVGNLPTEASAKEKANLGKYSAFTQNFLNENFLLMSIISAHTAKILILIEILDITFPWNM